ncbi:VOC family protein [Lacticaseibacillus baoqingensis]|uniref:VOC family protein n=1 Tax=Lacticaseibacillus baoqingensis TaxID=2486013 RepID=A0ABW4E2L2_9LACO|nr:VOC family protein [Lacticaseibacillus baoqingensis]
MFNLHHVSLLTGDIAATTAFYRDQLGLRLVKNTVNQENLHMRHLFYGDFAGSPGSVITFFEVPRLGPRYDQDHFMAELVFAIPAASTAFWQQRLGSLSVQDPNGVAITLRPHAGQLAKSKVVANDIPANAQILGWWGSTLASLKPQQTAEFFATMLAAPNDGQQVRFGDDQRLIFRQAQPGTHRFGRGSIDHVALAIPDASMFATLRQRAHDHGYTIERFADRGWFQSLYILTPAGNRVEFATTTPGFTLDEPLADLGRGLGLPPHLAAQRQAILADFAAKGVTFDD